MTIKELKQKIKGLPDHMDVMIEQNNDEYRYSMANEADIKEMTFSDGYLKAVDICFLITD